LAKRNDGTISKGFFIFSNFALATAVLKHAAAFPHYVHHPFQKESADRRILRVLFFEVKIGRNKIFVIFSRGLWP